MLVWAVLLTCATTNGLLMPSFCGHLPATQCINIELSELNLTLNAANVVESDTVQQLDDVTTGGEAEPGNWDLILDGAQLRESSRIRQFNDTQCPGATVFGTFLRFVAESAVIGGFEREFRVVFSIESESAWIGAAFALFGRGEDQFRVLAHVGCLVLQFRGNSSPFIIMASSQHGIVVDQQYEVRIRYGNGFVLVRLFEWPSLELVSSISDTNIRESAVDLGGDYALFSSDSDASIFESVILVDTQALSSVNELKPITEEPTPAPTPAPTASPTPAPTPVPSIDCVYSTWTAWSVCSQSARCMLEAGSQSRLRVITRLSSGGGVPCGAVTQSQICNADVPCPTSECNCLGCSALNTVGSTSWCRCCQFASNPNCTANACTTNNVHTKSACLGAGWCQEINSTATKHCGVDWYPSDDYCTLPLACLVGAWSVWEPCSRSCASVAPGETPNGTHTRSRNVTRAAKNGGAACPPLTESALCNTHPCPQDCVVGEWGEFAACTAQCTANANATEAYTANGVITRTRAVTTPNANNGAACPSLRDDVPCSRECIPDVDCLVSGYGQWSSCRVSTPDPACAAPPNTPRTCGNGIMTRTRSVVRQPLGNGAPCPSTYTKNDTCSVQCSVNCVAGEWSEWSSCTRTCGSGSQRRTRVVTVAQQFCGTACPSLSEQRACNTQTCAPSTVAVDCQISGYTVPLSDRCSVPACGNGTVMAHATILVPPAGTGKACPTLTITQPCHTTPCPDILSTPGIRWRIVSNDSINTFVWQSFRFKLAYFLAIDEERISLRSVTSGSTIVEIAIADAVDDEASNYESRLLGVMSDNSSELNVISSAPVMIPTTTAEPPLTRPPTTTTTETTTTVTATTAESTTTSTTTATPMSTANATTTATHVMSTSAPTAGEQRTSTTALLTLPPSDSNQATILGAVLGTLGALFLVGILIALLVAWKKRGDRKRHGMIELSSRANSLSAFDADYQSVGSLSTSDSDDEATAPIYHGPPLAELSPTASSSSLRKKKSVRDVDGAPPVMRSSSSVRHSNRRAATEVLDIPFDEMRLGRKLGEGAFGVVFKGKWHGNDIAVKQVKLSNVPGGKNTRAEFESEISQMALMAFHENLVQLHGVTTLENGDMAAVVEYCAHGSLATALYGEEARADLTLESLFAIAHGAACGVAHLHRQGVVHRDIAARNVLLTKHDVPKVADFGMARLLEDSVYDEAQTITTIGPIKWMAPEQMERRAYSKASDVFAFGVLLFEIFKREVPWVGVTNIMTATKVVLGERMDVTSPQIPVAMGALMNECWRAEPRDRPTMELLQGAIHDNMIEDEEDHDEEEEEDEEEED